MAKNWIQDAGHGGKDSGASANGHVEKKYTLEAATYVNRRLNELGINSDVTRSKDVTLSNDTRVNKVRQYKKCISHHFNSGGGNGVECFHSIFANGNFEKILIDEFRKAGYPVRKYPILSRRGSSGKDYFFMHRRTGKCRTTILEYEFLDGKNSGKLKSKSYREGMYECVVKAICRYEGVTYRAKKKPSTKSSKTLYRVQVGAFSKKKYAENRAKELKKKGFDTYIAKEGNLYKVQAGAFGSKKNAENLSKQLKRSGFSNFITRG